MNNFSSFAATILLIIIMLFTIKIYNENTLIKEQQLQEKTEQIKILENDKKGLITLSNVLQSNLTESQKKIEQLTSDKKVSNTLQATPEIYYIPTLEPIKSNIQTNTNTETTLHLAPFLVLVFIVLLIASIIFIFIKAIQRQARKQAYEYITNPERLLENKTIVKVDGKPVKSKWTN